MPPERKIEGTLDLVKGLLKAADEIEVCRNTRATLVKSALKKFRLGSNCSERQEKGKYQGRVVLMALAAELALKFAWEAEHPNCKHGATNTIHEGKPHDLNDLYAQLPCGLKEEIRELYLKRKCGTTVTQTAGEVFNNSGSAFVLYRYICEEGAGEDKPMRATDLKLATECVVDAVRKRVCP